MKINATRMFTVLVDLDESEDEVELTARYHLPEHLEMYAPEIAAQLYTIANEIFNREEFH